MTNKSLKIVTTFNYLHLVFCLFLSCKETHWEGWADQLIASIGILIWLSLMWLWVWVREQDCWLKSVVFYFYQWQTKRLDSVHPQIIEASLQEWMHVKIKLKNYCSSTNCRRNINLISMERSRRALSFERG